MNNSAYIALGSNIGQREEYLKKLSLSSINIRLYR